MTLKHIRNRACGSFFCYQFKHTVAGKRPLQDSQELEYDLLLGDVKELLVSFIIIMILGLYKKITF